MKFLIEQTGRVSADEIKTVRYLHEQNMGPIEYFSRKQIDRKSLIVNEGDFIAGGLPSVFYALKEQGVPLPVANSYPEELSAHYHREIWYQSLAATIEDQKAGKNYFVKPRYDFKSFTGCLLSGDGYKTLKKAMHKYGGGYDIACSERVTFLSEHRIYVVNGEAMAVSHYWGDKIDIDMQVIETIVSDLVKNENYLHTALDVGVLPDGKIAVIENNAAFSVDSYECPYDVYGQMIINGWKHLIDTRGKSTGGAGLLDANS